MLLGHALGDGDGVRKLQEPVVELAEVAEDERLYDPALVDEVALAPALRVVQVVVAARTAAALRVSLRVGVFEGVAAGDAADKAPNSLVAPGLRQFSGVRSRPLASKSVLF